MGLEFFQPERTARHAEEEGPVIMTTRLDSTAAPTPDPGVRSSDLSNIYQEGIVAGLCGAATIAVWFLILDLFTGRPLYTPTVLGTMLFRGGLGLDDPATLQPSAEMVLMFTWVHGLAFLILGGIASRLLGLAEKNPNYGFGI